MTPMTIAEYLRNDAITGRATKIDLIDGDSPFQVMYWQAGFTSKVTLTDLPDRISDLPKASRDRAFCAYLQIREQWEGYLLALRAREDYKQIESRDKKQRETRELLSRVMAPKEYLAAIQAVWHDMAEIDTNIANRLGTIAA